MFSAILRGDDLTIYFNGQIIYTNGYRNLKNKSVQVNGSCIRLIGEATEGQPTCFVFEYDNNGNYVNFRNELL